MRGVQDALDSRNEMPLEPNQQPFPGQRRVIPTHRKASSIPKGGTDSTWLYPSPQMFYNGVLLLSSILTGLHPCSADHAYVLRGGAESSLVLQP